MIWNRLLLWFFLVIPAQAGIALVVDLAVAADFVVAVAFAFDFGAP
ncbi:MAG: hypothetical protein QM769_06835 [Pseudoxanthomonas sp.]